MLCIADPGPEEEDLEELQDEGTEYDEDGERELKATEEEVDANPKPKTE